MVSIVLGILVVLFCISTVQVVYNYNAMSTSVTKLPSVMQQYGRANVIHDSKVALVSIVSGIGVLLLIIAYPTTYVLAYTNALVLKLYLYGKVVISSAIKYLMQ